MGVLFRDRATVVNVVSQADVVQRKVRGRAVREMRDHHAVGLAAMFVKDDQVCHVVGTARIGNVFDHVVAAVDFLRVGKDESHLLKKEKGKEKKR